MAKWKQFLVALGIAVAGALAAEIPSLVKDLIFLHTARIVNEVQAAAAAAAATKPAASAPIPK